MKNNQKKGEGPLQTFMVAMVIVSFLAFSGYSFVTSLGNEYGTTITNTDDFTTFNQQEAIENNTENIRTSLSNLAEGTDVISSLLSGGWNALQLFLLQIPTMFNNLVNDLGNILGIPEFGTYVYAIGLIIILFGVLALVMKVRA